VDLYSALFKKTSNALVALAETEEDCLKKLLFETVRTTRRMSELIKQRVSDRRACSNRKHPTAVCVESTST